MKCSLCGAEIVSGTQRGLSLHITKSHTRPRFAKGDRERAISLYVSGKGYEEVARIMGCGVKVIHKWVTEEGLSRHRHLFRQEIEAEVLRLYCAGFSGKEVADQLGVSSATVMHYCQDAGITRRNRWITQREIDKMLTLYERGLASTLVAKKLGRSHAQVYRILDSYNVIRSWDDYKALRYPPGTPPRWVKTMTRGYVVWQAHRLGSLHVRILEHRLVMEKHLGRALRDDEDIHHKNRNRSDNRLSNLQVMSKSEHSSLHQADPFELSSCPDCDHRWKDPDECHCVLCHAHFTSLSAFDKHASQAH